MLKPYSTKRPKPVPPEYEDNFVRLGHSACQHMYGKRAAQRYFTVCGGSRLRGLRDQHLAQLKAAKPDGGRR